jgi:hypothetical protein
MTLCELIRGHAEALADDELRRRHSLLGTLPPRRAAAVADVARAVATATADCLHDLSRSEPALRAALDAIYGRDG